MLGQASFLYNLSIVNYIYTIDIKEIKNGGSQIIEFPLSTIRICGKNIPFGGGFYFRFWSYKFIDWCIRRINKNGKPAIIYIHPFDLDPDIPSIRGISLKKRVIHYHNICSVERKLKKLLKEFRFSTIRNTLKHYRRLKKLSDNVIARSGTVARKPKQTDEVVASASEATSFKNFVNFAANSLVVNKF